MKTVLNIKTDVEVKERPQALAKHLGIPLSTIVKANLKAFIETGEFKVTREPELSPLALKEINQVIKEVRDHKNISPRFTNATDAIAWLNKIIKNVFYLGVSSAELTKTFQSYKTII